MSSLQCLPCDAKTQVNLSHEHNMHLCECGHVQYRKSTGWGGQGLADLKVHKSKLQKDKDAWAKAVSHVVQCAGCYVHTALCISVCMHSNGMRESIETSRFVVLRFDQRPVSFL